MHILLLCVWSFPRWVFLCGSSHWYFSMALSWCKIQTFEKLQCYNYCSYCFLSYKLVLKACFVLLKHNFWMYQTHITAKWFIFLADILSLLLLKCLLVLLLFSCIRKDPYHLAARLTHHRLIHRVNNVFRHQTDLSHDANTCLVYKIRRKWCTAQWLRT